MKEYSFERLDLWQSTRSFTKDIYKCTQSFPKEEKFGIVSQIRRATISVANNIAEGTSRWSYKEKYRFIEIAFGSLMEVLNCMILSFDLGYLNEKILNNLRLKVDEIANKLNSLAKSFQKKT
jgi:four helix bundle protein